MKNEAHRSLGRILKDFENKVNGLLMKSSSIVRENDSEPDYWVDKALDMIIASREFRKDLVNHYDPKVKGHP